MSLTITFENSVIGILHAYEELARIHKNIINAEVNDNTEDIEPEGYYISSKPRKKRSYTTNNEYFEHNKKNLIMWLSNATKNEGSVFLKDLCDKYNVYLKSKDKHSPRYTYSKFGPLMISVIDFIKNTKGIDIQIVKYKNCMRYDGISLDVI